jgi:hypothetical protein
VNRARNGRPSRPFRRGPSHIFLEIAPRLHPAQGSRAFPSNKKTLYDHTSVLATIESKWNLPALTNRDANAATVMDFLDLENPATLLDPPPIQAPSETGPSGPVPAATG